MENNQSLPVEDLKLYGILNSDNSFTQKISQEDIQKFLEGFIIVADNDKRRITFQLQDNNSKLNVNIFERDKKLSEILQNSKEKIQYSDVQKFNNLDQKMDIQKKAFIYDDVKKAVIEYDFINNAKELTKIILDKNDLDVSTKYKNELEKLKSFLLDKIDQYPEIAKEITDNLNIVSNEINNVNSATLNDKQISKANESNIRLDVNDKDLYEDANRIREENKEEEQKGRGFKR